MGGQSMPGDIILTAICNEPEGKILRTVRLFEFNRENLMLLYSKISKFPTLMGVEINRFEDMFRYFVQEGPLGEIVPRGLCLVVDDFVGLFWLTDIFPLHQASVHYTFFDKRHKGREELCKEALKYAFHAFQFNRLWTQVPVNTPGVLYFVEKLGFHKVGRQRRSTYFKGKYYDTNMYDLLREEIE